MKFEIGDRIVIKGDPRYKDRIGTVLGTETYPMICVNIDKTRFLPEVWFRIDARELSLVIKRQEDL